MSFATHSTHGLRRNQKKTEICNARRTQAKNATHATDSILASVVFFVCVHCGIFLSVLHDQHALRTLCWAAWKLTFKSVFIGLHTVSKLSYATHTTQRTLCNAIKNRNTQRMHAKDTTHAINSILCVFRVHTLHPLRCVRQLRNRPLSLFSAF